VGLAQQRLARRVTASAVAALVLRPQVGGARVNDPRTQVAE